MRTRRWPLGRRPNGQIGPSLKIYGGPWGTSTGRASLSDVRTVGYGVRQRDDALHLLFLRQVRRVQQHRLGGLNGLHRVARGTPHELLGLFRDLRVHRAAAEALHESPSGPLPRIGDEEDLEGGIGEDRRPDVASVDDDVMLG